jgi:uncharacterized protein YndB with AHSA1/START domain
MSAWTHEHACSLPAAPALVFAALTEPRELERWFAEHAEVELRAGGAYRFWGRHTYGTPSRSDARQVVTRFEPSAALAYRWPLHELDSEVSFALADDEATDNAGGTRLVVRHAFPGELPVDRPRHLVDDLWRLSCANLQAHLEGGDGLLLPDFDDPSPEVRVSIFVDAPRERVFRALVEPELLNGWIAAAAEVEPREGGRYRYGWSYEIEGRRVEGGPTRILELVENERLVTDWPDWRGDETVPVQTITWTLESEGSGTRVTVVHSGFVRAADLSDYGFGWPGFLAALKSSSESAG